MSRSKREIPHYYLANGIDMRRAIEWLERQNEERSISDRILPAVLLLKATALAVTEVPELNGTWTEDGFRSSDAVHVVVVSSSLCLATTTTGAALTMTRDQARQAIFDVLTDIAPEVDPATVDDRIDLTEQLDLDSMDYLTWMIGINEATGVEIPQREVSRFLTIEGAVSYLVEHTVPA